MIFRFSSRKPHRSLANPALKGHHDGTIVTSMIRKKGHHVLSSTTAWLEGGTTTCVHGLTKEVA
jgi:hypothetical protein